jgi:hypothetical protein
MGGGMNRLISMLLYASNFIGIYRYYRGMLGGSRGRIASAVKAWRLVSRERVFNRRRN